MYEKTGKATVIVTPCVVPIAYDGDCAAVPIARTDVESALAGFEWKSGYVGFRLAEEFKASVEVDGLDDLEFSETRCQSGEFRFADRILSTTDLANAAFDGIRGIIEDKLKYDPAALVYMDGEKIRFLRSDMRAETTLIDRKGQTIAP